MLYIAHWYRSPDLVLRPEVNVFGPEAILRMRQECRFRRRQTAAQVITCSGTFSPQRTSPPSRRSHEPTSG